MEEDVGQGNRNRIAGHENVQKLISDERAIFGHFRQLVMLFGSTIALTSTVRLVHSHENVKVEKIALARDRARRLTFVIFNLFRAMSLKSYMMDLTDE